MEYVNINEIKPPRVLLKKHSKMQIKEIADSIKEFGQYRPVLVQSNSMQIICGYGIYLACKKLKMKEILIKRLEINNEEADNIRFTDNYSNESSKWNEDKLQYLFMEMPDELIKVSGFEIEEVENIFNDSTELLKRGIEQTEKEEEINQFQEKEENYETEETNSDDTETESTEIEKKEEVIKNVEFIKIRYCGCCGKYYDSEGNEVDLLR